MIDVALQYCPEAISTLLSNGYNVNQRNAMGLTALHMLVRMSHSRGGSSRSYIFYAQAVTGLLNAGADPSLLTPNGELAQDLTDNVRMQNMLKELK